MLQASGLLEKAEGVYDKANAKEAGDGTLQTLTRRVAWLEQRVKDGNCRK
jgi:hypothetical protein